MSDLDSLFQELDNDEIDERINIPDAPLETITIDDPPSPKEVQIIENTPPAVDLVAYHKMMDSVTDDVLTACKKDRAEIQEVVDLMFGEIRNDQEAGRNPSRGYTDNLTKLLEVKANVNMIAVKMMEANAKMLSATKAGAVTVNNNNMNLATGDDYLKKILAEPLTATDEY